MICNEMKCSVNLIYLKIRFLKKKEKETIFEVEKEIVVLCGPKELSTSTIVS